MYSRSWFFYSRLHLESPKAFANIVLRLYTPLLERTLRTLIHFRTLRPSLAYSYHISIVRTEVLWGISDHMHNPLQLFVSHKLYPAILNLRHIYITQHHQSQRFSLF